MMTHKDWLLNNLKRWVEEAKRWLDEHANEADEEDLIDHYEYLCRRLIKHGADESDLPPFP